MRHNFPLVHNLTKRKAYLESAHSHRSNHVIIIKFRNIGISYLKSELAPSTPGFRTLCPTRWTVRALSLQSVIDNYEVLNALWDTVKDSVTDSEVRARIIGIEATMSRFDFLFGAVLGERLLKHTDNLSIEPCSLQHLLLQRHSSVQC